MTPNEAVMPESTAFTQPSESFSGDFDSVSPLLHVGLADPVFWQRYTVPWLYAVRPDMAHRAPGLGASWAWAGAATEPMAAMEMSTAAPIRADRDAVMLRANDMCVPSGRSDGSGATHRP